MATMALSGLAAFVMFVMSVSVASTAAQEAPPLSGLFHQRTTPCLLAKYNSGPKCDAPAFSFDADPATRIAARKARAYFFVDLHQLPEALVEAEEALKLEANDADLRHLVARLSMSMQDLLRAERELTAAMALRPNDPNIRASKAQLLELSGATVDAVREYSQVLDLQPTNRFARVQRARLHLRAEEAAAAVFDLDLLIAENPDSNHLALRSSAWLMMGEPQKAIEDLTEALKLQPKRIDLIIKRAAIYQSLGKPENALWDLDTILGRPGTNPRFAVGGNELANLHFQRARLMQQLGRRAEAAAEAISAIQVGGTKSLLRAQTFLRQNGFPETPLDGKISERLQSSVQACFGLNSCFQRLIDNL